MENREEKILLEEAVNNLDFLVNKVEIKIDEYFNLLIKSLEELFFSYTKNINKGEKNDT